LDQILALAEKHVAQTRVHIEQQRQIINEQERRGFDSTLSRQILATFEQSLELHTEDRDRLITALSKWPDRLR
jgi:hypothetical protein